ncbi:hypothetical protein ARMSODRAFT_95563 [Armillaria solidipes]|uniref:Uncharacterized protein n=1 Tax=Armillaria solidipes TaxID=1076256 RepID=A0A2H3C442_9AGAR|nr:hypothetical protein ARMSODRAFT_95563 [Armillaria solidipes]
MWFHLASSTPLSRFGHFFSGISAIFVERMLLQPDHNALLVSPHYHLFRDGNPPASAEYPFITADRCCQKGIPLLAILTFLLLPNESVRQGVLPAVRNVISVQEMGKTPRALTRLMTDAPTCKKEVSNANDSENGVSAGTARASTISFSMEYPGMNRLPRLLVPQTPHNAPSMDTVLSCMEATAEDPLRLQILPAYSATRGGLGLMLPKSRNICPAGSKILLLLSLI